VLEFARVRRARDERAPNNLSDDQIVFSIVDDGFPLGGIHHAKEESWDWWAGSGPP
jgi:hypothetical protein